MKKSFNIKKTLCFALATGSLLNSVSTFAISSFQPLEAYYNDIRISVNDEYKSVNHEPFIIDGVTYVSVRDIGNLFNISSYWDVGDQTVKLTGGLSSTAETTYKQQIAQLQAEINTLEAALDSYENTLSDPSYSLTPPSSNTNWGYDQTIPGLGQTTIPGLGQTTYPGYNQNTSWGYGQTTTPNTSWGYGQTTTPNTSWGYGNTGSSSSSTQIKEIDKYAIDDALARYEEEEDIEWSFSTRFGSSVVDLDIEFYGDDFRRDYDRLSTSKIEGFIEDVCAAIMAELVGTYGERHTIEGKLTDTDSNEDLVIFEYDNGRLDVEEVDIFENIDDIIDIIEDDIFRDDYDDIISMKDNESLTHDADIEGITLDVDRHGVVEFVIEIDFDDDAQTAWNDELDGRDKVASAEDLLDDVIKELENEYDLDARDGDIVGTLESRDGDTLVEVNDEGEYEWSKF